MANMIGASAQGRACQSTARALKTLACAFQIPAKAPQACRPGPISPLSTHFTTLAVFSLLANQTSTLHFFMLLGVSLQTLFRQHLSPLTIESGPIDTVTPSFYYNNCHYCCLSMSVAFESSDSMFGSTSLSSGSCPDDDDDDMNIGRHPRLRTIGSRLR